MSEVKNIKDVIAEVKSLESMAKLKPEVYAEKDGWADVVVKNAKINATQLRKIFHHIKQLKREFKKPENFNRAKIAMIMPSLAYARGRQHIEEDMYDLLTLCFGQNKCRNKDDFDSAANFLEAILAYHKYYHPKD